MTASEFEYFSKAMSNPLGMSNEAYSDGTPKSNMEAYRDSYVEEYTRKNDFH